MSDEIISQDGETKSGEELSVPSGPVGLSGTESKIESGNFENNAAEGGGNDAPVSEAKTFKNGEAREYNRNGEDRTGEYRSGDERSGEERSGRMIRSGNKSFFAKKKVCRFCTQKLKINYKESDTLRRFITDRGKILPRRITGTCARHQRALAEAIKQARAIAMLPFVSE